MYKFIFLVFGDEIVSSLDEQIEVLKKYGIEYLEFRFVNGKNIVDYIENEVKEVLKKLKDNGIKVLVIGFLIGKVDVNCDFEKYFEFFKYVLQFVYIFEIKYICIFLFYVLEGEEEKYIDVVIERFLKFIEIVKRENFVFFYENEKEIYGNNFERCFKIFFVINLFNLRVIFDLVNFVQCKIEVYFYVFEFLKDYIEYVYIKDVRFLDGSVIVVGEGDGRVKDVIEVLKRIGFCGFLLIEFYFNNNFSGGGFENFEKVYRVIKKFIDEKGEI